MQMIIVTWNESISLEVEAIGDAGFDTFKVVARQATHTILAACSSEQQKCSTSSSCSVCCHSDNTPQFQKSTLMPNCCRQCFYAFVNNVVSSTMTEKGCAWSALFFSSLWGMHDVLLSIGVIIVLHCKIQVGGRG